MNKPVRNPLLDAASEELERAQRAVRYRFSQIAEVEEEFRGLEGWSGMFSKLVGTHEKQVGEIKKVIAGLTELRDRAVQAMELAELGMEEAKRQVEEAQQAETQHLKALEAFAGQIRKQPSHPAHLELRSFEDQLQQEFDEVNRYQEALQAGLGLLGSLARIGAESLSATNRSATDAFGIMPFASQMAFLQRRKVQAAAKTIPEALARFNETASAVGLPPIDLEIPDIGSGWLHLSEGILADYYAHSHVTTFVRELNDERDMVRASMTFYVQRRDEAIEKMEHTERRRRAVLERYYKAGE